MSSSKVIFDFLSGGVALVGLIICVSELLKGYKKIK